MKGKYIALAAIVAITVAAAWIYRGRLGRAESSLPASIAASAEAASPALVRANAANSRDWQNRYGCDTACADRITTPAEDAAIAYSSEEASWLARQGFLSAQDRARFEKMSQQEIERLIEVNDGKAIVYAAMHPQRFPDIAPAASRLAAQEGWSAVSLLLGNASMERADKLREQAAIAPSESTRRSLQREADAVASNAAVDLMKAAIRGDYLAAKQVATLYPDGIPSSTFELAVQSAAFDALGYKDRHGRSLQYDPRPRRPIESGSGR